MIDPAIEPLSSPTLAEKVIDDLACAGFFVLNEFLDARQIAESITAIESLKADSQSSRMRRGVAFARRNLLGHAFVQNLLAQPRVGGLLQDIGRGSKAVRAILFDKTGPANWTVPWHQDRSIAVRQRIDVPGFGPWSTKAGVVHVQPPVEILRQMITLRFHLDPCGEENGPLRVIGGTHDYILHQGELAAAAATRAQTPCVTGAGGLVVMRPLLLHASSPAAIPSHRRVIHVEFGPPALPGGLNWATAGE